MLLISHLCARLLPFQDYTKTAPSFVNLLNNVQHTDYWLLHPFSDSLNISILRLLTYYTPFDLTLRHFHWLTPRQILIDTHTTPRPLPSKYQSPLAGAEWHKDHSPKLRLLWDYSQAHPPPTGRCWWTNKPLPIKDYSDETTPWTNSHPLPGADGHTDHS